MRRVIVVIASLATLVSVRVASADPITAGQVFDDGRFHASFDLSGAGFSLHGGGEAVVLGCDQCLPGPHQVGIAFNGLGVGSAEVNGISYSPAAFELSVPLLGTINIPADGSGGYVLTFPFALQEGSALISLTPGVNTFPPIREVLDGAGFGVIELAKFPRPIDGQAVYDSRSIVLTFTDTSSATPAPEPATLLLMGGGATLWLCIGRRRSNGSSQRAATPS